MRCSTWRRAWARSESKVCAPILAGRASGAGSRARSLRCSLAARQSASPGRGAVSSAQRGLDGPPAAGRPSSASAGEVLVPVLADLAAAEEPDLGHGVGLTGQRRERAAVLDPAVIDQAPRPLLREAVR